MKKKIATILTAAVEKKHNGYNCAQAVACSFCKEASMDEDTLKKITQGFGAGLGTMAVMFLFYCFFTS